MNYSLPLMHESRSSSQGGCRAGDRARSFVYAVDRRVDNTPIDAGIDPTRDDGPFGDDGPSGDDDHNPRVW